MDIDENRNLCIGHKFKESHSR